MVIDGRKMADGVLARAKARAQALAHAPRVLAIATSETPATKSYLSIKEKRAADAGCEFSVLQFPDTVSAEELQSAILASDADAIIVQLPLAEGINAQAVCDAIPVGKDADVLSDAARQKFARDDSDALLPPVVGAVAEIFHTEGINPKGKHALVIGRGFLVGAPVAMWLAQHGAQVATAGRSTPDFPTLLADADIIISGAGSPHLITPGMLKKETVLIDAGTSESGGTIVGDANPSCAAKCSVFTPVPGGVGPLAVAKLFENAVTLAEKAIQN